MNDVIQLQPPVDRARGFINRMVLNEARSTSDTNPALARISDEIGVGFWTLEYIRKGKAKTIDTGLFNRIRQAYLGHCEWKIKSLAHEIRMERHLGDDTNTDILTEAETLLAKIQAERIPR